MFVHYYVLQIFEPFLVVFNYRGDKRELDALLSKSLWCLVTNCSVFSSWCCGLDCRV